MHRNLKYSSVNNNISGQPKNETSDQLMHYLMNFIQRKFAYDLPTNYLEVMSSCTSDTIFHENNY